MNVVIINKSDSKGGAAVVSLRLMNALRELGVEASMLVCEKQTASPHVHLAAPKWRIMVPFLAERLRIFLSRGVNLKNLFKFDTASDGLPLHHHPLVKGADVICLNWVNQGMLSLKGLRKLQALGKPIVWTMHDMWCFTGACHHAGACRRFKEECGCCPLLSNGGSPSDLTARTFKRKRESYERIHFVAVSNWLAGLARESALLGKMPLTVIPNAFPVEWHERPTRNNRNNEEFRIVFGAARLDDPVKGHPILVEATRILAEQYPDVASRLHLITFGNIKTAGALDSIALRHTHLGTVRGEAAVREIYLGADAVVSTSLYETLPGTLVEGQAYGCIPITFGRGGQADIVEHLSTGYIADYSDHLHLAAANIVQGILWAIEQDASEMRRHMFESVKSHFESAAIAQSYLELFESLMSEE